MDTYISKLRDVFINNNVCESHGINHALSVLQHAKNALSYYTLSIFQQEAVLVAALLHDADDNKFFPNNKNNENLRLIVNDRSTEFVDLVIEMVNLVAASKNGNSIPDYLQNKLWMLVPRYADRLESIGFIGIQRCFQYCKTINRVHFVDDTPKLISTNDIIKVSLERFKNYHGESKSMIDHFYDKLIAISFFPKLNPYFDHECECRRLPLIHFVRYFAKYGKIDDSFFY